MRVVGIFHAGRDATHHARERALVAQGVELRLIVPTKWPGPVPSREDLPFEVVELPVERAGDVNRHRYSDPAALATAVRSWNPDVVDVHEEPVSVVAAQCLKAAGDVPVVMYSAQNLDKRWPPPFHGMERRALSRVQAFYPCSRQAAAVLRAKGYRGLVEPLPLGVDLAVHQPGDQDVALDNPAVLGLVGRLVPEKGLLDALAVTRVVAAERPTKLVVVGLGPDEAEGRRRAQEWGLDVEWHPWLSPAELAKQYRRMHVVLVPSKATATWVEQFGRVITEGWANGAVVAGYPSGSIPEVVGKRGVLGPDVTALATGVADLLREPSHWAILRTAGLVRAAELDWTRVAAATVALYERAQAAPALPAGKSDRRAALAEFGLPVSTSVSRRPFAMPYLRTSPIAHRLADRVSRDSW